MLFHVNDWERQTWDQRDLPVFNFDVAPRKIEWHAGESGSHLETAETCGRRGGFADLENSAADSAPCPGGMYEERSYLCRIAKWIQQSILAARAVVASEERLALAPASAAGYDLLISSKGFGYKIGSILD